MALRSSFHEREVVIPSGTRALNAILTVPAGAIGVVAFAHGSGRFSSRNQFVARALQKTRLAALLLDPLEDSEADD